MGLLDKLISGWKVWISEGFGNFGKISAEFQVKMEKKESENEKSGF